MTGRRRVLIACGVLVILAAVAAATPMGRSTLCYVLPVRWTGEADRLATVLDLAAGEHVADIGAGSGALAIELARAVGPTGKVYATELTGELRDAIASRASRAGLGNVEVVAAAERSTNLADACCHAVVMRHVFHHIVDQRGFARDVRRSIRVGGRVAIIDFRPDSDRHGVTEDAVIVAFTAAGLALLERDDAWGGRSFLVAFELRSGS